MNIDFLSYFVTSESLSTLVANLSNLCLKMHYSTHLGAFLFSDHKSFSFMSYKIGLKSCVTHALRKFYV